MPTGKVVMRTRSTRRERGADVAPGFPRRDDRQNDPASSARSHGISAPSRLLRLALLVGILVAGAAAPHDPSVDAAAHVGGDVYALDLLPSRGPALGGTRVTFHGRGFTTDMACQFGPHTILPTSVSPEGDTLVCVTPPFGRPAGGFIAVGITITTAKAWPETPRHPGAAAGGAEGGAAGKGRPVVTPRGARSFEYAKAWVLRGVAPSRVDSAGGGVVWATGAHLHAVGSCRFESPALIGGGSASSSFALARVVSSALIACEAPATGIGVGALAVVSENPSAAETVLRHGHDPGDAGVPGLALVSRRPPKVHRVVAAGSGFSNYFAGATLTMYGSGFDAGGGSNREDDWPGNDAGGGVGGGDDWLGNGAGCAVGTVWVAATYSSPGRVDCSLPDLAPGAYGRSGWRTATRATQPPATSSGWRSSAPAAAASLAPGRSGRARGWRAGRRLSRCRRRRRRGGSAAADFFGAPPDDAFGVCVDSGAGGTGAGFRFRCVAGARPGGGFVAVSARTSASSTGLAGAPHVALAFAYVRAPTPRAVAPREGPSAGGYVAWITGDDYLASGAEVRCLFAWAGADAVARRSPTATVVSSTLAACEAPPAATASGRDVRAFAVDVGSHALGWSDFGLALVAWPASLRVTSVAPSVVAAAGGAFVRLSGRSFPASAEAAWCRVGSVGPVAARVESSSAIGCATPATRPTAAVPVTGPSAAVGVVSVDVVGGGWGDDGVGLPSAFPARTGSGTPSTSASASASETGSAAASADATTDVRTPIARVYPLGATPDPGSLAAWLADGAARCVFSNDGGGGGGVAAAAAAGVHAVDCPVPLTPPGFVSARVVVGPHGSSVEAVGSVEIEFRPSPVVSGLRGGIDFGGGGSTASAGENAVFDVDGAGFFPGLTCVWCGVAGAEANVLSSVAARCEQPGLETLRLTSAAGAAEGVACALGLVSGGADDGLLGAAAVADGPTALITPFPGETTAVAPSGGPASGGTAATARTAGFSRRGDLRATQTGDFRADSGRSAPSREYPRAEAPCVARPPRTCRAPSPSSSPARAAVRRLRTSPTGGSLSGGTPEARRRPRSPPPGTPRVTTRWTFTRGGSAAGSPRRGSRTCACWGTAAAPRARRRGARVGPGAASCRRRRRAGSRPSRWPRARVPRVPRVPRAPRALTSRGSSRRREASRCTRGPRRGR